MTRDELHMKAGGMRRNPTPSEAIALKTLCSSFEIKRDFWNQQVLGYYIVDFVIPSRMLVIEIDGAEHYRAKGAVLDSFRDSALESWGLTVLRITNNEASTILDRVIGLPIVSDWQTKWQAAREVAKQQYLPTCEPGFATKKVRCWTKFRSAVLTVREGNIVIDAPSPFAWAMGKHFMAVKAHCNAKGGGFEVLN